MNNDSIVIYRSRTEQLTEQFWIDTAIPWMFDNWIALSVSFVISGALAYYFSNRKFRY